MKLAGQRPAPFPGPASAAISRAPDLECPFGGGRDLGQQPQVEQVRRPGDVERPLVRRAPPRRAAVLRAEERGLPGLGFDEAQPLAVVARDGVGELAQAAADGLPGGATVRRALHAPEADEPQRALTGHEDPRRQNDGLVPAPDARRRVAPLGGHDVLPAGDGAARDPAEPRDRERPDDCGEPHRAFTASTTHSTTRHLADRDCKPPRDGRSHGRGRVQHLRHGTIPGQPARLRHGRPAMAHPTGEHPGRPKRL